MFLYIQKKFNIIFIILFTLLSTILFYTYNLIKTRTQWGFIEIFLIFMIIIMAFFLIINFIQTHLEISTIYRIISKKKIALAKINDVEYYKAYRDIFFKPHEVYKMNITVYTQEHKTEEYSIFEDVAQNNFSCLPAYVYVTFDDKHKKIGIIPTFVLFMTPKLKDIVKQYEEKYHPYYVEVSKKNGLSFKNFSKKKKNSQNQ